MTRAQKIAGALMTILLGLAAYAFFAFKYPYHLHFQEQYQLFEGTWDYFAGVVAAPGGFADWLSRFLVQFFYYATAGAAIMAVLFCGVQLLAWAVCRRRSMVSYALSFLPVVPLFAYYCDENALVGGTVALILALAAAALCIRVPGRLARRILAAALVPLLYAACGPLAVVFAGAVAAAEFARGEKHPWRLAAVLLALLLCCPFVAQQIHPYTLWRLFFGVHYHRYRNVLPLLLWVSALLCLLLAAAAAWRARKRPLRASFAWGLGCYALIAVAGLLYVPRLADLDKEEWMHYDFMVRMEMWNRIMMKADVKNPDNPITVACLNLALAKTGRMNDHLFDYFQNGPEGLLPNFVNNHFSPVPVGEIYWHLGMVNTAQRFAFEAQEAIPDFQKSARCYKRLAQTNIVNGDWDVARKYLKALQHARFYRRWAKETVAALDAGDIFERQPDLARIRDLRLKEHDFLYSDQEKDSMLGLLRVENASNGLALDYLMALCMLDKNLDRFVECLSLVDAPTLPKSYQEALLLRWVLTHDSFQGLPEYLSSAYARRISSFISDSQAGRSEAEMQRSYGDTFWFYYYYRFRQ